MFKALGMLVFTSALITAPVQNVRERMQALKLSQLKSSIQKRCALKKGECVRQIPLRDFFRNPDLAGFSLSPDGSMIAFLKPVNQRMNLFLQKKEAVGQADFFTSARQMTALTDRDLAGFFFKGNDTLVYSRDFGGDENFHLFAVDIKSGDERDLTPFEGVKANVIDDLKDNKDEMIVGMNRENPQVFDAYRVNVRTGELTMEAKNPGNIMGWETDHNGRIRMANMTDGVNTTLLYRDVDSEEFTPVLTTDFREGLSPLFFTFDNQRVYAASNLGRDKNVIVEWDPKTQKEVRVLFEHPEVDVSGLTYSRHTKELIAAMYTREKRERYFLNERWKDLFARLQKEFPGLELGITDMDDEEKVLLIRTYSDRSLGATYLYDWPGDSLTKLADMGPWLNEDELAPMQPITYEARDGLKIQGYLTLPLKKSLENLPVIVLPHGGPWARDNWGFRPDVQFFANRGYAVLQMNFRGSTGFGRNFWELSFKKWGLSMQDDITDAVNWLIEQGIADSKRIGIYGASYGGYAVLAGLAFTPDLYACGVDYVGVSNLFTLLETIPPYWKPMLEMMYEMVGHPETDAELLRAASPVFHADKITAPLFIAQGARDPRVKKSESDQIVEALKKRGVEVPYMVKDNEGHGFRNEENRFELYEAVEKFLGRHLYPEKQ